MSVTAATAFKPPSGAWAFKFDMSQFGVIVAGDTLASATVTCPDSTITIGTVTITGAFVQVPLSGGTAGVNYYLTIAATTTAGAVLPGFVVVVVSKPTGF